MYLKIEMDIDYENLAERLCPGERYRHDAENKYEWMYLNVPGVKKALNFSREHNLSSGPKRTKDTAGPTRIDVHGKLEDKAQFDSLAIDIAKWISSKAKLTVHVHEGRFFYDNPDNNLVVTFHPDSNSNAE